MIEIRKAIEKDITGIRELFRQTILSVNLKDYTPEQAKAWADRGNDNEVWKERIAEQYFIVAEINNVIVGFAALKPDGYLNSMFVHTAYQGIGIASALLNDIEKQVIISGLNEITADVSITANPFFEKRGFKVLKHQTVNI